MHLNFVYILGVFLCAELGWCGKYNVSYTDLDKCKEFNAAGGYGYHTFFNVKDIRGDVAPELLLNIRLYVLAAKDAHILLSTTSMPELQDPVYEIVLGAGGNTFSEIRKKRKSGGMKTLRRSNLLSAIDPLPIDIRIAKNGSIEVQVVGEPMAFLNTTDSSPIPINYISFSTWGTTEAKWFYDCSLQGYDELERFNNKKTNFERLNYDLFNDYDVYMPPQDVAYVPIQFQVFRVHFNTLKSTLETRAILKMNWKDSRLVWNTNNYGDIKLLRSGYLFDKYNIWFPAINVINGKDKLFNRFNLKLNIYVDSTGNVTAESEQTVFETWCSDIVRDGGNWPVDKLICNVELGIDNGNFTLKPMDTFVEVLYNKDDFSEWHLWQVNVMETLSKKYFFNDEEIMVKAWNLKYQFKMNRNSQFYSRVFCPPLIVSTVFILLSFWSTKFIRATLSMLGTLIIAIMFVAIADFAPNFYIPPLVRYYQAAFFLSWLTILLFIFCSYIENNPPESEPWQWMIKSIQMICFHITSDTSYISKDVTWLTITKIVDKIFFIIFSVIFIIALFLGI